MLTFIFQNGALIASLLTAVAGAIIRTVEKKKLRKSGKLKD